MSFFSFSDFPKPIKAFSVAIVHAEFNAEPMKKLLENTVKGLKKCGLEESAIEILAVPGSLEIPFLVRKLMDTGDFDGIIALGIVIRGETYHFELVANETVRGLMELNLEGQIPVISGILAGENDSQIAARLEKGGDFAKSLVKMMNLQSQFRLDE